MLYLTCVWYFYFPLTVYSFEKIYIIDNGVDLFINDADITSGSLILRRNISEYFG